MAYFFTRIVITMGTHVITDFSMFVTFKAKYSKMFSEFSLGFS